MSLRQLFKNTPLSVFTEEVRRPLQALQVAIGNFVAKHTQDSYGRFQEFDNLLEIKEKAPWILRIMQIMQGHDAIEAGLQSCREIFALPAFQACWLMDGGDPDAFSTAFTWRDFAQQACEVGPHSLLLKMEMNDPDLALRATGALLKQCFETPKVANVADSQQLAAFAGFNEARDVIPELPRTHTASLRERIEEMTLECTDLDESIRVLLNTLVYTPGLKLKSQGFNAHQIIHNLTSEISAIFEFCTDELPQDVPLGKPYAAFHRQVLINLFSPFSQDLAYLDAHAGELVGNIRSMDTDSSTEHFVRSLSGAVLAPTFRGPLVAHSGQYGDKYFSDFCRAYRGFGVRLDPDSMFGGFIDDVSLHRKIIRHHGPCKTVEKMLADLCDSGTSDLKKMESATLYALEEQFEYLSPNAQVGFIATRLEIGAQRLDAGEGRLWQDSESPKPFLDNDPVLKTSVLDYMRRNALLDHALLEWCGFHSSLLKTLGDEASISLKESFLAQDLGI
jgi:hypothetical protein